MVETVTTVDEVQTEIVLYPHQTPEQVVQEAQRLCALFQNQPHHLIQILATQFGVLKTQAQTLMSLCGLTITVTGFSGAHMIRAGTPAALSMVCGIGLILVAIFLCLSIMMRLQWVTQELGDDYHRMLVTIIQHRNEQQHRLVVAGVFVALGLTAYLFAVILAALLRHQTV